MQESEVWLPVVGYAGCYVVSNMGRVRSLDRIDQQGRHRPGKLLTERNDLRGAGYRYVNLSKDGIAKKVNVHVLVLEAFVGPRPSARHEGCHADGDRTNPRLSNLHWGTPEENWADRWRHGTESAGEKSPAAVLTDEMVRWILESPQSSLALAPLLGVASSTIRAVRIGQNWGHRTGRGRKGRDAAQRIAA